MRTSTASDRAGIDDLLARYGFALDLRDFADLRSVFAEAAEIGYSGSAPPSRNEHPGVIHEHWTTTGSSHRLDKPNSD